MTDLVTGVRLESGVARGAYSYECERMLLGKQASASAKLRLCCAGFGKEIVPWNAQMFLKATKLGTALAAGCTVVLKASEVTPAQMLEFARLI